MKTMWNIDLRYVLVLVINIVKSHAAMPWEWDPFKLSSDLSWIKLWLLVILLFFFSFVSVQISSTSLKNLGFFKVRIRNLSPSFVACFMACVLLPQIIFWYVYPLILFMFSCYTRVSTALKSFVRWIQDILSHVPDLNILVTAEQLHEEEQFDRPTNLEEGSSIST